MVVRWDVIELPAWKGAHVKPNSAQNRKSMTTYLDKQYDALRSDWQIVVGPLQTNTVKTATTPAATDYKDGALNISADPNSELLGYTWAAISAIEKEQNIDQALSTLRRMQELLTLNLTGGLNHE